MSSTRGVRFLYRTGESVLCFEPDSTKAKVLYDAKVLDTSVTHDKSGRRQPAYLIHFLRWNSSWDRVVPESYLLKNSDDNRILMRKLTFISQKESGRRRNKARSRKIERALRRHFEKLSSPSDHRPRDILHADSSESDSDDVDDSDDDSNDGSDDGREMTSDKDDNDDDTYASETHDDDQQASEDSDDDCEMSSEPVKLDLPPILKQILQRDRYLVKVRHSLLNLPSTQNVVHILESYVKNYALNAVTTSCIDRPSRLTRSVDDERQMALLDNNIRLRREIVDGLRVIFDFTLPLVLLYDCERSQYDRLTTRPPITLKLEIPSNYTSIAERHHSSPTKRPARHRGRQSEDAPPSDANPAGPVVKAVDSEVNFKSESGGTTPASSPRGRQTSPRRATQKRRRTSTMKTEEADDVEVIAVHSGRKRNRTNSKESSRQTSSTTITSPVRETTSQQSYGMPPPLLAAHVNSATSSSRTTSPERPLPRLTAAVLPHLDLGFPVHHQSDVGFPVHHQSDVVADVLSWRLVPDEFLCQQPPPPSVVYGPHHLLRLFVKLPSILDNMYIPRLKLSHLVTHFALFIQYLADHSEELFVDSAYSNT